MRPTNDQPANGDIDLETKLNETINSKIEYGFEYYIDNHNSLVDRVSEIQSSLPANLNQKVTEASSHLEDHRKRLERLEKRSKYLHDQSRKTEALVDNQAELGATLQYLLLRVQKIESGNPPPAAQTPRASLRGIAELSASELASALAERLDQGETLDDLTTATLRRALDSETGLPSRTERNGDASSSRKRRSEHIEENDAQSETPRKRSKPSLLMTPASSQRFSRKTRKTTEPEAEPDDGDEGDGDESESPTTLRRSSRAPKPTDRAPAGFMSWKEVKAMRSKKRGVA